MVIDFPTQKEALVVRLCICATWQKKGDIMNITFRHVRDVARTWILLTACRVRPRRSTETRRVDKAFALAAGLRFGQLDHRGMRTFN